MTRRKLNVYLGNVQLLRNLGLMIKAFEFAIAVVSEKLVNENDIRLNLVKMDDFSQYLHGNPNKVE